MNNIKQKRRRSIEKLKRLIRIDIILLNQWYQINQELYLPHGKIATNFQKGSIAHHAILLSRRVRKAKLNHQVNLMRQGQKMQQYHLFNINDVSEYLYQFYLFICSVQMSSAKVHFHNQFKTIHEEDCWSESVEI